MFNKYFIHILIKNLPKNQEYDLIHQKKNPFHVLLKNIKTTQVLSWLKPKQIQNF